MAEVILKKGEGRYLKSGGAWIYDNEIDKINGIRLADFQAGNKHNAIPRDGAVVFAVPEDKKHEVKADFNVFVEGVKEEFCWLNA